MCPHARDLRVMSWGVVGVGVTLIHWEIVGTGNGGQSWAGRRLRTPVSGEGPHPNLHSKTLT